MNVIRPIAYVDADTDRIGGRGKAAHAKQSSKKQRKFLHSCLLRL